jgi:hypothetical protein
VFLLFGTKKALFVALVGAAAYHFSNGMSQAAKGARGPSALAPTGAQYYELLAERTTLCCSCKALPRAVIAVSVHLYGRDSPACGRGCRYGRSGPGDGVVLAFGVLLNNMAALDIDELDELWAKGVCTRIHAGLFEHITTDTNR